MCAVCAKSLTGRQCAVHTYIYICIYMYYIYIYNYVLSGAHKPPKGWQGASNYVQRHLTMSGSDTFLIWTFPQVGNLSLWSLHVRVKQAQRTTC